MNKGIQGHGSCLSHTWENCCQIPLRKRESQTFINQGW